MQNTKIKIQIVIFTIICVLFNICGKYLATTFNWPIWLDSLGTVLTAYCMGPLEGAIVGLSCNIIYSFWSPDSLLYSLVSIMIGVVVGFAGRKGWFKDIFGSMSCAMVITIFSVLASVPFNILVYGGKCGNLWGDQVIEFLTSLGFYPYLAYIIGEFYVDFLDKMIIMLLLLLLIRLGRKSKSLADWMNPAGKGLLMLLLITGLSALMALSVPCFTENVCAAPTVSANDSAHNYNLYAQTIYDETSGLSGGTATDMVSTKDGMLWVGTYNGLYQYNGISFTLMTDFDSVKNVNNLYVDEEGRLFIGTNDNGLVISIGDTQTNSLTMKEGMPSNSIRSIVQDSGGDYYVGTTDSMAVVRLNGGLQLCTTIDEIKYASSITADDTGNVVTVTDNGEMYLLQDRRVLSEMVSSDEEYYYTSCTFADNGDLYVGTSTDKIFIYTISGSSLNLKKTIECPGIQYVNSFSELEGVMFLCSDSGVGYIKENYDFRSINTGNFNSSIDSVLIDYQNNIWFTSSRLGILRLSKVAFSEFYKQSGLDPAVVNTTCRLDNLLYLGTDEDLRIIDLTTDTTIENEYTQMLKGIRIRGIKTDSKKNLWICTTGHGLYRISQDGEVKIFTPNDGILGDRFRTIIERKDGSIIAAGDSGLSFLDGDTITRTIGNAEGLYNSKLLCAVENSAGRIYAGSDGGGIFIIQNGSVVGNISTDEGLSSGVILRIVPDTEKDCYFIVLSNGICYMNAGEEISYLSNFPYSNSYDMTVTGNGNVWVLGSGGIYVVNRESLLENKEDMAYELLNSQRGLTGNLTANAWNQADDNGDIYLSKGDGASLVNTGSYDELIKSYRMSLSEIIVDDTVYKPSRNTTLEIDSSASRIEITPQVLNYSMNDPLISYYLEGFESEPRIINVSEITPITYMNLPAGSYTFHMSLMNGSQTRVLEAASYSFVKKPELYETRGFRIYFIFVFALIITYITWFITRIAFQKSLENQRLQLEFAQKQLQMGNEMVFSIARTVDAKDSNTSQHSMRVSEYSVLIANRLGFSKEEQEKIRKMGLLHDIGKIGIPDSILNKPARLTDEEYAIMKSHVDKGGEILKGFTLIDNVADGAIYHHERWDGKGYSHGLKGEEIPLNARIIGIADAFDAMTANRVYRKKLDFDYVLSELK